MKPDPHLSAPAVVAGVAILCMTAAVAQTPPPGFARPLNTPNIVPTDPQILALQRQVAALQAQVNALLAVVQVTPNGLVLQGPSVTSPAGVVLQGPSVTISASAIKLSTPGNIEMLAGHVALQSKRSALLPGGGDFYLSTDTDFGLDAGSHFTVRSSDSMSLRASTSSEVVASGNLNLKGTNTYINSGARPVAGVGNVVNASGQVVSGSPSVFVE